MTVEGVKMECDRVYIIKSKVINDEEREVASSGMKRIKLVSRHENSVRNCCTVLPCVLMPVFT
jgi:hypothetical protein